MATTSRLVLLVLVTYCHLIHGFSSSRLRYLRGNFNLNVVPRNALEEGDQNPNTLHKDQRMNPEMDSQMGSVEVDTAAEGPGGELVADNILDDGPLDASALSHHSAVHLEWWHFLLIALAICFGIAVVVFGVIRCCRYKAHWRDKMEEFLDKYRQYALIRDGNTSNYEDLVTDSDPELMGRRITL